jgi:hypothetical protein
VIAETLYCAVMTAEHWRKVTDKVSTVIQLQPYNATGAEQLFCGKQIYILKTLGM